MPYICQKGNDRDNQSDRRRETIEEFMICVIKLKCHFGGEVSRHSHEYLWTIQWWKNNNNKRDIPPK